MKKVICNEETQPQLEDKVKHLSITNRREIRLHIFSKIMLKIFIFKVSFFFQFWKK